jgi:3-oxoacyl-[acyl-carrier protein] reductase
VQTIRDQGVLVTGAGRGIGKRLAIGFAARGARVGLVARSKPELDLCHLEIEHAGGTSLRIRADVCDYEQIHAAVDRMRVHYGGVHTLICAAGVLGPIGEFSSQNTKHWTEIIHTNLIGVMNATRAVLPQMIERRSGKIIVLAGDGTLARPGFSVYAASKGAVVAFVESLAEELREHNVQINALAPGATYTHMTDQILHAGDRAGWREIEEAERVRVTGGIAPEKQVELAVFLASEQANHISGKLIDVHDDLKRLKQGNVTPEIYTLRRAGGNQPSRTQESRTRRE